MPAAVVATLSGSATLRNAVMGGNLPTQYISIATCLINIFFGLLDVYMVYN